MRRTRFATGRLVGAWIAVAAAGPLGCREPGDQAPFTETCPGPPKDVRQTFDCLRAWHERGSYAAMRPYLDPDTSEDLVDLLVAMDELTAANAGAQAAIRRTCPETDPARYDLSYLQQYLAFFSKDVEYVREKDKGNEAVVFVQIGGRMPLQELQFRRHREGRSPSRWVYVPGGQVGQLAPLIRDVAGALSQIALVLSSSKNVTPELVRSEFEVRIRQRILKKAGLVTSRPASSAPAPE